MYNYILITLVPIYVTKNSVTGTLLTEIIVGYRRKLNIALNKNIRTSLLRCTYTSLVKIIKIKHKKSYNFIFKSGYQFPCLFLSNIIQV